MSKEAMRKILNSLAEEEYLSIVGQKASDPLDAFAQRRAIRPGMGGQAPIMPPARAQGLWQERMSKQADAKNKRAAYIHIPFCSHICLYCGFFQNYANEAAETHYLDHLAKELEADKDKPYLTSGIVNTVFFGGGTPSALSPSNITRLLQTVRNCLPLANDCEITLEARINDLTGDKMDAWFANGVNRVSIGVQSFDTAVRQSVGRLDSQEECIERLTAISARNQASIIIDIIYGLPGQTGASFRQDLKIIDRLPIDGMDLYQLSVFEDGPLIKAIGAGSLPPAAKTSEQARMFADAVKWLDERAYFRLSSCHWAKNSRERSMYNFLVKSGVEIFPYGSGAGGNIGGMSVMLCRDLKKYCEAVGKGLKPIMVSFLREEGGGLSGDILRQLEIGYFNLGEITEKYGGALDGLEVLLDLWVERGLFEKGPALYRLSVAGQFWVKNIAQLLTEYAGALRGGEKAPNGRPAAGQG
ncbi:MAG: heme anaerobic degradation radical SAM methyltransferase ChuW/HutW [Acidaminococcales bacterium]|jgi:oxygen-independent coproporphyrinogen-3 oxidase|nr:heme anaerobic degradation radical SAM methyltransferase ChuW/HutW [Acidaminococcales bacterium]